MTRRILVEQMSDHMDLIGAPRDRDQALSCAFLRLLGSTQAEAAKAANVDPRTLGRWEGCSWWRDVMQEASQRWLAGLAAKARLGLTAAVEKDGYLALRVLERLEPALAPGRRPWADIDADDLSGLSDEELERIVNGAA